MGDESLSTNRDVSPLHRRGVKGNDGMGMPPLHRAHASVALLACLVSLLPGIGTAGASDLTPPVAGFENVTQAVGLSYLIGTGDEEDGTETSEGGRAGGGLALADVDGDGWPEPYVAHGAGETGRLFSWNGRRFDAAAGNGGIAPAAMDRAGYFIDLDDDGVPDFLSVHAEGTEAFRNDGSGRFEATPNAFGSGADKTVFSLAASDCDSDGDLDPFFAHWNRPWTGLRPPTRYLWRNDGKGRYEDVSHIVPVRPGALPDSGDKREFSFTPTFSDIDDDGDPDLLLAGDFGASQVLRNDAGAAFTDITGAAITDENGMGAAAGDFDRDGDIDWFVSSIRDADGSSGYGRTGNRLYRNLGDGRFEDATDAAGVRAGGWGWGTCLADFDNDGHQDLFLTDGRFGAYIEHTDGEEREITVLLRDPSRLFMANGDGTFTERASELGVDHTGQGRGVVCADYDGDGRVDILIANHGAAPTVYRNVFERRHHWLAIDLAGQHAIPQAIGARVTVRTASGDQVREVRLGTAYLSQAPPTLHFGLGPNQAAQSVEVRWPGPGGQVSRLETIAADRRITIYQAKPAGFLLRVALGTGAGHYGEGETAAISAAPARGHDRFSHWNAEGGGVFGDARAPVTTFAMPAGPATVFAHYLPGPPLADTNVSLSRRWMEVLLQAIRANLARPTVHARNLFHLSAAMYDAWAAWSETASPYQFGEGSAPCPVAAPPAESDLKRARGEAISHAAWRLIRHRFARSPGAASTLRNGEHLGKIKFLAWRGPDHVVEPATDAAGVGWILAENWWPYQRPSFVTPPFAGYVSGHSTYSRAGAEVLTALTGDPFFPGGMSGFPIPANEFLVFERGPSVDMVLQWATYRDAADQCSLSRIWGGIHPPADDIPGASSESGWDRTPSGWRYRSSAGEGDREPCTSLKTTVEPCMNGACQSDAQEPITSASSHHSQVVTAPSAQCWPCCNPPRSPPGATEDRLRTWRPCRRMQPDPRPMRASPGRVG